jgi:hypothetical protein
LHSGEQSGGTHSHKLRGAAGAFDFPASLLQHRKKVLAFVVSNFDFGEVFGFGLINIAWGKRS